MKVTIKGWVAYGMFEWQKRPEYSFFDYKPNGKTHVTIAEHTIEVDAPDDFDPRGLIVRNLEEQKRSIEAEFHKRVTEINAQIQSLLAIEA